MGTSALASIWPHNAASRWALKVRVASGEKEPLVQGWTPAGGYKVRPIPTPIFEKEQLGPASVACVLFPTPQGAGCPVTRTVPLDIETDGAAACVRTRHGRIEAATVAGGTALTRRSEPVPARVEPVRDLSHADVIHQF